MIIKEIESIERKDIKEIVAIHMKVFKNFFLTFLGKGFLKHLYRSYCQHSKSNIIIAVEDDKIVGFLAYSLDYSEFFKYLIKRKFIIFGFYSFLAFLRKPRIFLRLLRAFFKPKETKRKDEYIQIASLAVDSDCQSKGIGTQLLNCIINKADFTKYKYLCLETDALNNDYVNNFYLKNGFVLDGTYETKEKRIMNEYHYYVKG